MHSLKPCLSICITALLTLNILAPVFSAEPAKPAPKPTAGTIIPLRKGRVIPKAQTPAKPKAIPEKPIPSADIEISTPDKHILTGKLYDPILKPEIEEEESDSSTSSSGDSNAEPPAYKGPTFPLVILLHGLDGENADWGSMPRDLVKLGFAVFAADLRGHGKSVRVRGKRDQTWRVFQDNDWQQLPKDVLTTISYFQKGEGHDEHPEVNASTVGLAGSKLGANVALIAGGTAALAPKNPIKALILISPNLNYKGLKTTDAIVEYNGPVFFIASQTDPTAFTESQKLYRWALGAKVIQLYKSVGDGTDMLLRKPDIKNQLVTWLGKTLARPVAKKDAPAGKNKPAQPAKK